jgi:hypothetical protein
MLEVGRGLTPEQARQRIKREFPAFLNSLDGSDMDKRQFLRLVLTPPTPEEKIEMMLRKFRAMGHQLTIEQLDQVHELTFAFFDSLLQEIEEERGSTSLAQRSSIEPES